MPCIAESSLFLSIGQITSSPGLARSVIRFLPAVCLVRVQGSCVRKKPSGYNVAEAKTDIVQLNGVEHPEMTRCG